MQIVLTEKANREERIRNLNDAFRQTFQGGRLMLTCGVVALPEDIKATLLQKVRTFDDFSADNDPHLEHDFGSIELDAHKFFWKIDYYDGEMDGGSEDPADPAQTKRVLTIMRADEY